MSVSNGLCRHAKHSLEDWEAGVTLCAFSTLSIYKLINILTRIRLNSYQYRRKVPGVEKQSCQCGYPSQNVKHMVLVYPQWANGRGNFLR